MKYCGNCIIYYFRLIEILIEKNLEKIILSVTRDTNTSRVTIKEIIREIYVNLKCVNKNMIIVSI